MGRLAHIVRVLLWLWLLLLLLSLLMIDGIGGDKRRC